MNAPRDRGALDVTEGRIPDGRFRQLGPINWVIHRFAARVIRVPRVHLFTTLGQHKRLFRAWLFLRGVLYAGRLPKLDSELVILRVAHLRGCKYELQHHRRFAEQRVRQWPQRGVACAMIASLRVRSEW